MILHPCFNEKVKGQCGRVHLPVAPKCNIKCNYCDRKYDCVNESRPGVTSTVLSPYQAVAYLKKVLEKEPRITVVGIAGPGDPFANPVETMETLRLVKKEFPDIILCLATNGLNIGPYVEELKDIGVTHVTITINAVDPKIGSKIYSWVRDGKVVYRGIKGAELLLRRQKEAIKKLKDCGITVKTNYIVIPGINDHHVADVAREMKGYGVDLFNCMAMFPNPGAPFGTLPQPSKDEMDRVRAIAEEYLPQMRHCTRCRADAVGLLEADRTDEFRGCLSACSKLSIDGSKDRKYVAVATREGILVNQHLGEATSLEIWGKSGDGFKLICKRETPPPGTGIRRWVKLSQLLFDCKYLLVSGIGENPRQILEKSGIRPIEMSGFIEEGLDAIFNDGNINAFKKRKKACCSGGMGRKGCL
ncbi:Nitrogenase FeMo-cofactor synthesis FeS core scaffold and assembly protein NifB [Dissulfuribacter thermophilus]|uniref:FeMo cofactor biosynthesis protein NifB n=1 Tax=Dissulfuribacter thermophilus TaxID=1156395 RepID=A0A1B9F4C2_9BACT|nr:radical SAM protein [Dissulfuribacter thermophilus]OCC14799.1 Nitrogenase FeMo-cofactor synthesis FeS core scaffold and assembly protein NifB [Dissulfuribacter thermophilus]